MFCVSFLSYDSDEYKLFIIDHSLGINDREELIEFIKDKTLVGYNNLTFDNLHLNYIVKHPDVTELDLYNLTQRIIGGQKNPEFNIYKEFKSYIYTDLYDSIDLMRTLFSKKLRVSLKELECSLNFFNVEELPYEYDAILTNEQKLKIQAYNKNDVEATKLVLEKTIPALKLRRWMQKEYGINAFSMDGVSAGVNILATKYEKEIGDRTFLKDKTIREMVKIKDIILPFIKFDSAGFQGVLEKYQKHTWYSKHFDEKLFEDSGLTIKPKINNAEFKFSLGGLHFSVKAGK